jgi:preprotein translocase subunit SecG
MIVLLTTIHVTACVLLIMIVLLQAGRGAGLAVFGGGGDTLFASPSGSSALKKATVTLASVFALTSLMLTLLGGRAEMRTVTGRAGPPVAAPQAPATPSPAQKP